MILSPRAAGLLVVLASVALVSCTSSTIPAPDGGLDGGTACPPGQSVVYLAPGCDGTARWFCQGPVLDACAAYILYCSCDGTSVLGSCGGASAKPYSAVGACPGDADGGSRS
jgi:hypothetical protein